MFKKCILSMSVGRASAHDFVSKIDAIADAGFQGIELFYEDLEFFAKSLPGGFTNENQLAAARSIRQLCDDRGIEIICLQPLIFYEGLIDPAAHEVQITKIKFWFKLLKILGAQFVQIPTNFLEEGITGDIESIVKDMVEIADLGLQEDPPIRFAYEAMAWGHFLNTWTQVWEIVKLVDRPNFGMLLDTFQIAARDWADPTAENGVQENADELLEKSLDHLIATIDVNKVFYIQIGDAERPQIPVTNDHEWFVPRQPPRMGWGRNARTFANDTEVPGYLPVARCVNIFINRLGYRGWVSCEVFSRFLFDSDPDLPAKLAKRASHGWDELLCGYEEPDMRAK